MSRNISQQFPLFRAHRLLRGGHAQTLASVYFPGDMPVETARQHVVKLPDGDAVVLHDDCPPNWSPGDRMVLMMHGLSGSHQSSYMRRIAGKLAARGRRVFRMDLRGCGAGFGLARLPYHSGRSEDAQAALEYLSDLCASSPVTLLGFSLSANITLKLLGELEMQPCAGLDSAIAVSPPVDLLACVTQLKDRSNRIYDRHFLKALLGDLARRRAHFQGEELPDITATPRHLWEFDDYFTAPVSGFGTAERYYQQCSSLGLLHKIQVPSLIILAQDDPLIPWQRLAEAEVSSAVDVYLTPGGGHLGFIGQSGIDPDRRWIDWRVLQWIDAFEASK